MPDVSTVISVDTRIAAGGVPRRDFGRGLLISTDERLSAGGATKARLFNSLAESTGFFASDSQTLAALRVWFAADPPPQGIYVGRWANTAVDTSLRGGRPSTVAQFGTSSTSTFTFNGETITVDLSTGITDLASIAAKIQTAIRAATGLGALRTAATFAYDTDAFLLSLPNRTDAITGGAFGNTASSSDTDIAGFLGMDAASNPRYVQGSDAESVTDAMGAILSVLSTPHPVAVMLSPDAPNNVGAVNTRRALAAYCQTAADLIFALPRHRKRTS